MQNDNLNRDPDPLVVTRSSQVKRRSVFTIIGYAVVAALVLVVAYFAWVGWRSKGRPVPEMNVTTRPAAVRWVPGPAAPAARAAPAGVVRGRDVLLAV